MEQPVALQLCSHLSGASNGDSKSLCVGTLRGSPFTVYCSGKSLIILDENLKRIQEIHDDDSDGQGLGYSVVDICHTDGKFAACIGGRVLIYRPRALPSAPGVPLGYHWHRIASLPSLQGDAVRCISWNPRGDQLAIGGSTLAVWSHEALVVDDSTRASAARPPSCLQELRSLASGEGSMYIPIACRQMPSPLHMLAYSPDGRVLASVAQHDRLVKVWHALPDELRSTAWDNGVLGSFVFLEHPRSVAQFSWRSVSELKIHAAFVRNVLVTACADGICRVWSETPSEEPCGFYIATSIDPETYTGMDTLYSSGTPPDTRPPFVLHWLDTHDLLHTIMDGTDKCRPGAGGDSGHYSHLSTLATALITPVDATALSGDADGSTPRGNSDAAGRTEEEADDEDDDDGFVLVPETVSKTTAQQPAAQPVKFSYASAAMTTPHAPTVFSREHAAATHRPFESSGTTWADVLYFVHPNGSLVFWSISFLDDSPRRTPYVKLISGTVEGVIRPADAQTLAGRIVACRGKGLSNWKRCVPERSASSGYFTFQLRSSIPLSFVMHHSSGDVTTWCATFADNSSFGEVVRVSEHARSTGPRYATSALIAHPVLPYVVSVGCAAQVGRGDGAVFDATHVVAWRIHAEPPHDTASDGDDADTNDGGRGRGSHSAPSHADVDDAFGTDARVGRGAGASGNSSRTYMHGGALRHITSSELSWPSRGQGGDHTPFGTPTYPPAVAHWLETTPTHVSIAVYSHGKITLLTMASAQDPQNDRAPHHARARGACVDATIDVAPTERGARMYTGEAVAVVGCSGLFAVRVAPSTHDTDHGLRFVLYALLEYEAGNGACSTRLCAWRIDYAKRDVTGDSATPLATVSLLFHGHELCSDEALTCRLVPSAAALPVHLLRDASPLAEHYLCGTTSSGLLHVWEVPEATDIAGGTDNIDVHVPKPVTPPGGLNMGQYLEKGSEIRLLDVNAYGQLAVVVSQRCSEEVVTESGDDAHGCRDIVLLFDFVLGSFAPTPLRVGHMPVDSNGHTTGDAEKDEYGAVHVRALAWGCGPQQQHLVYVVVGAVLAVYTTKPIHTSHADSTLAHTDCFDTLALLSRTVLDLPTAHNSNGHTASPLRLTPTANGVVLVSHGQEVLVFSGWAQRPRKAMECDTLQPSAVSVAGSRHRSMPWRCLGDRLRSIDEMGYVTGDDLPYYHAAVLLDCLLSGKRSRVTDILAHLTKCFRDEEEEEINDAPASDHDVASTTYTTSPLPFRRLLHATDATASDGNGSGAGYSELFTVKAFHADDTSHRDDVQAQGTFPPKDAEYLCSWLTRVQLHGLSRLEQVATVALVEAIADLERNKGSLDECGVRFLIPVLQLSHEHKSSRRPGYPKIPNSLFVWALHSDSQEYILEQCPDIGRNVQGYLWEDLRAYGAGYWIKSAQTLRQYVEKIARNTFAKDNKPLDAAIWYLILNKKTLLWSLFKSVHDTRLANFFGYDFTAPENQTKALKNAYALMGKQRFREAVAFFVLADALDDAVNVCVRNLKDVQLGIVVCRLVQGDDSPLLKELFAAQLKDELVDDPVGRSMVHWLNKDYHEATKCLLDYRPTAATVGKTTTDELRQRRRAQVAEAPMVLNLCRFLQQHQYVKRLNSTELDALPHIVFHCAYQSYTARGLSLLALDTLADYHSALQHRIATAATATEASETSDAARAQATADAISSGTFDFGSFGGFDDGFPAAGPAPVVANAAPSPPPTRAPTSVFGGLMAQSKATPTSASTAAAINSGTFDFGSFGGFDDEFSQFDESIPEVSDVADDSTSVPDTGNDRGTGSGTEDAGESEAEAADRQGRVYSFSTALVRMRQSQLIADVVTRAVVQRAAGPSWDAFRRALLDDADTGAALVGITDAHKRAYASQLFYHVYRSACALDLVHVQCLVRPHMLLRVLDRLTNELVRYITAWAQSHAPYGAGSRSTGANVHGDAPSDDRARHVVEQTSACLLQLTCNLTRPRTDGDASDDTMLPSATQLAEYTLVPYGALVVAAWKSHDSMRLVQLQLNAPGARMWNHLCAGVSSAKGLAELCRQHRLGVRTNGKFAIVGPPDGARGDLPVSPLRGADAATPPMTKPHSAIKVTPATTTPTARATDERACNALVAFLDRPMDEQKWINVDVGARMDEDGNVVVSTYAEGTPELQAEQFRFALLDLVAAQHVIGRLRYSIMGAGAVVAELERRSPALHAVMDAFEEFAAALQLKLDNCTPVRDMSLDAPTSVFGTGTEKGENGTVHSVRGVFKVHKLLDPSTNKFQSLGSRRLWDFLIRQEALQKTVEYHMFQRTMPSPEGHAGSSVTGLSQTVFGPHGKTHQQPVTDIHCITSNCNNERQVVVGTGKGVMELVVRGDADVAGAEGDAKGMATMYSGTTTPPFASARGKLSSTFDIPNSDAERAASPVLFAADGSGGPSYQAQRPDELVPCLRRAMGGAVRAMAPHPSMPCYIVGTHQGDVDLYHFEQQQQLCHFRSSSRHRITSVRFSDFGNKFGACNSVGEFSLWRFLTSDESDEPFLTFKVDSKRTNDFSFLSSTSMVATAGQSSDGTHVSLWDTLLVSTDRSSVAHRVRNFDVNEGGSKSLAFSPASQRLMCGGLRGEISVVDFRQHAVVKTWYAHEGVVNRVLVDESRDAMFTASSSGDVKMWSLSNLRQMETFEGLHARSTFSESGVVDMVLAGDNLYTCGSDGVVKLTKPWC
eukprot:m.10271 g.10271  ORF g.10271 m.10271 type:complete len:2710 (-) comp7311_c0_seq1:154-8283(-)